MKTFKHFILLLLLIAFSVSCSKEDTPGSEIEPDCTSYKVAVIMPGATMDRWKRTAEMFAENLAYAQKGLTQGVKLDIEWYDESTVDLKKTASSLVERDDIKAIIGPMFVENVMSISDICSKAKKLMISLTASSDELARKYANVQSDDNAFLMLSESGITQCEGLVSIIQKNPIGFKKINLIAKDDSYGQTYLDWLSFVAVEMDLEVGEILEYNNDSELDAALAKLIEIKDPEIANVVILSDIKDYNLLAKKQMSGDLDAVYTADKGYYATSVLKEDELPVLMEGLALSSDPASGFDVSYAVRFQQDPILGEAHLYDALMIMAYSLFDQQMTGETALNKSVHKVTQGSEMESGELGWMKGDMRLAFSMLNQSKYPNIKGATGDLSFDKKNNISVLQSVYKEWTSYQSFTMTNGFFSSNGTFRTDPMLSNYNWNKVKMQEFKNIEEQIYPKLIDKWAVLVAGSTKWSNYRHQADVLSMYQMLVKNGFSKDHIILIMEDDIANNPLNVKEPGQVKLSATGENLYTSVTSDYKPSEISPEDLENILMGNSSENLKKVLNSTYNDNVYVFWSGHGEPGSLMWGNKRIGKSQISNMLTNMKANGKFRKLMFVAEACYAGSVAEACVGIPGLLFLTAANAFEQSKASLYDEDLQIWRTNSFTISFRVNIEKNPKISIRELYYDLFKNTLGSHVSIYNETNYGSMQMNTMDEFVVYK